LVTKALGAFEPTGGRSQQLVGFLLRYSFLTAQRRRKAPTRYTARHVFRAIARFELIRSDCRCQSSAYFSYDSFAVLTSAKKAGKSLTARAWDKREFVKSSFSRVVRFSSEATGNTGGLLPRSKTGTPTLAGHSHCGSCRTQIIPRRNTRMQRSPKEDDLTHPTASLLCADNVPCNLNAPWTVPSFVPTPHQSRSHLVAIQCEAKRP
jgi:hypothetical protein